MSDDSARLGLERAAALLPAWLCGAAVSPACLALAQRLVLTPMGQCVCGGGAAQHCQQPM